jgi:Ca2+-binding EF-hand superfamily protein
VGGVTGDYGWPIINCKEDFAKLDADGSGSLSIQEFVVWPAIGADCGVGRPDPMSPDATGSGTVATDSARPKDAPARYSLPRPQPCGPNGTTFRFDEPKGVFEKADQNRDREIDPGEFCTISEALFGAPPPPDGGCGDGFRGADADGDGRVSVEEYVRADFHGPCKTGGETVCAMVMPTQEVLKNRFVKLDLTQDGFLDPKEWCNGGFISQPPTVDPRVPNQPPTVDPRVPIMPPIANGNCPDDERDANGDGLISWDEFYTKRTETIRMTPEGAVRFKEQAYAEFQKRDTNGDGSLDQAERGCTGGVKPAPNDACAAGFKDLDADRDGFLSPEEYVNGKWGQIRFIQAPTKEEEQRMRDSFRSEFKAHDFSGDARLSYDEHAALCKQP